MVLSAEKKIYCRSRVTFGWTATIAVMFCSAVYRNKHGHVLYGLHNPHRTGSSLLLPPISISVSTWIDDWGTFWAVVQQEPWIPVANSNGDNSLPIERPADVPTHGSEMADTKRGKIRPCKKQLDLFWQKLNILRKKGKVNCTIVGIG
jgi:hypothetical protein